MSAHRCPHLVALLGYCSEYNGESKLKEQILVYEFMDAGDLGALLAAGERGRVSEVGSEGASERVSECVSE